jgi:hypothetical protein
MEMLLAAVCPVLERVQLSVAAVGENVVAPSEQANCWCRYSERGHRQYISIVDRAWSIFLRGGQRL